MLLDQARALAANVRDPEDTIANVKRRLRPTTAETYVTGTLAPHADGPYMLTAEHAQAFLEAVAIQNVDAPLAHWLEDSDKEILRVGAVDVLAGLITMLTPRHFATRSTQAVALPLADIEAGRRADLLDIIL